MMNRYVVNTTQGQGAVLSYHELLQFLMLYYKYKDEHPEEFIFKLKNWADSDDLYEWDEL
jgi:hypothetical protein